MPVPGQVDDPDGPRGARDLATLRAGGMPADQVQSYRDHQAAILRGGGFTEPQITSYFGEDDRVDPRVTADGHTQANRFANTPAQQTVAHNPWEAFQSGLQASASGYVVRGGAPPTIVDDPHASLTDRVVSAVGQTIGDLPVSLPAGIGGGIVGGAAGSETGPGAILTAGAAGGFAASAAPEAVRQSLMLSYRSGTLHTPGEWLNALTTGTWRTLRAGVLGEVSGGVGGAAARPFTGVAASAVDVGVQSAVAPVFDHALQGNLPSRDEFIIGAITAIGPAAATHVGHRVALTPAGRHLVSNLTSIFERTGMRPVDAIHAAQTDPALRDEIMSQDVNGDPVTPRLNARAPAAPPPYEPPGGYPRTRVPTPHDQLPARQPIPPTGGVDHFMVMMGGSEGSFNRGADQAVSPVGARGRFQIMPGTARQYGFNPALLMEPHYNEMVARTIAGDLYRRFGGDEEAMLAAYNAGPGRGAELQRQGPGTRLVAVHDRSSRTGWRYESEAAARNETHLPYETQTYLARARAHNNGDLPGSRGGASSGSHEGMGGFGGDNGGGNGPPSIPEWAMWREPPSDGGAGGGGGGEPPNNVPTVPGGGPPEGHDYGTMDADGLHDTIRQRIGEPDTRDNQLDPSRLVRQYISELEPARQIDRLINSTMREHGLGDEYDPRTDMTVEDMFRQTLASPARAGAFMELGIVDAGSLTVRPGSTSGKDAVHAVAEDGGNMRDWMSWMAAQRAVHLEGRGVKTGFNLAAANELIGRKGEAAKYERATRLFNDVLDGGLEYGRDSGIFSTKGIASMKALNPVYVSFRRIMGLDAGGLRQGGKNRGRIREIEGSDRLIENPLIGAIDNLHQIIRMADRNRAIGDLIGRHELVKDYLGLKRDRVVDGAAIRTDENSWVPYQKGTPALGTEPLIAQRAGKELTENQFLYYRDGQAEVWSAKNPEVARLLRGSESQGETHIIDSAFSTIAKLARAGIVNTADFAIRMTGTDQISAFVLDPNHPPPFLTFIQGAFEVLGNTQTFKDWYTRGGAGSALADMDVNYISRNMHGLLSETGALDRMWNTFKHPLELAQIVQERIDAAQRVGYYKHVQGGRGLDPIKAATASRQAYLDFAEHGTLALVNMWARWTPFFRPGLLGAHQAARAVGERPLSTAAFAMLGVQLPSILLYGLNWIQDEYGDLPPDRQFRNLAPWQRYNQFILPEIAGVRFRLNMPHEIGPLLAGTTTRFLDEWTRTNPDSFRDWFSDTFGQMVPNMVPPAILAPLEQVTNHSFYTGRALVPASVADASGHMQYTPNTSQVAIQLAQFLHPRQPGGLGVEVSPVVIDNYVRGWTGSIGQGISRVLDIPLGDHDNAPWTVSDIPFVQGFVVRQPGMGAQPIQDFYANLAQARAATRDLHLAQERESDQQMDEAGNNPLAGSHLDRVATALSHMSQAIRGINADDHMSVDEKRQFIEQTYSDMIVIARDANSQIDQTRQDAAHAR